MFLDAHGGTGRCVVSYLGRAGFRVVLIGADGAFGDIVTPLPEGRTPAEALAELRESLVAGVTGLESAEWDRSTTEALVVSPALRRRMAG